MLNYGCCGSRTQVRFAPRWRAARRAAGDYRGTAIFKFWKPCPNPVVPASTYDDGVLEITVPLEDHEFSGRLIERFILTLVELMGLRIKTMGSTTMTYPHLRKGG